MYASRVRGIFDRQNRQTGIDIVNIQGWRYITAYYLGQLTYGRVRPQYTDVKHETRSASITC